MSFRLILFGVLVGIVSLTRRLSRIMADETSHSSRGRGRDSVPPPRRRLCTTCRFAEILNGGGSSDELRRLTETLLSGETRTYCEECNGCPLVSHGSAIVAALCSWWRLFEPVASLFFLPFTFLFYIVKSPFRAMRPLFVAWMFIMTLITRDS
ncbi:hypothetical protein ACB092_10G052500 [Castanea dentata]